MFLNLTNIPRFAMLGLLAVGMVACQAGEESVIANDTATRSVSFFVALGASADANQTQLYVAPQVAVDPNSVVFCVGAAAACQQQPITNWMKTIAGTMGGRQAFASTQPVSFGNGTQLHIYAKSTTGAPLGRSVEIRRKGAVVNNNINNTQGGGIGGLPITNASTNVGAAISDCYKGDAFICEVEALVAQKTNEYRAQQSKSALAYSGRVGYVSRLWSQAQFSQGMGHDGFPSQRRSDYIKEFGSMDGVTLSAENVAYNSVSSSSSAESVAKRFTDMWWNSPGHKKNMLGNHHGIGVGFVRSGSKIFGTQIFYRK